MMFSSDWPLVSGRHSTANGMKATQTKPKNSSVPPAPNTSSRSILHSAAGLKNANQREESSAASGCVYQGVSVAERLFAGPQLTKVHRPTAFPRTRSGMILTAPGRGSSAAAVPEATRQTAHPGGREQSDGGQKAERGKGAGALNPIGNRAQRTEATSNGAMPWRTSLCSTTLQTWPVRPGRTPPGGIP